MALGLFARCFLRRGDVCGGGRSPPTGGPDPVAAAWGSLSREPHSHVPSAAPPRGPAHPVRQAVQQGPGDSFTHHGSPGRPRIPCLIAAIGYTHPSSFENAPSLLHTSFMKPSLLIFQMSHLFNVAHTLRLMVQKERSLDILKVGIPYLFLHTVHSD